MYIFSVLLVPRAMQNNSIWDLKPVKLNICKSLVGIWSYFAKREFNSRNLPSLSIAFLVTNSKGQILMNWVKAIINLLSWHVSCFSGQFSFLCECEMYYEHTWFVFSVVFHLLAHIYDCVSYGISAKADFQVWSLVS